MDNQHKKIKGYGDLSQEEINLMNEIKELADQVGMFIHHMKDFGEVNKPDQRWVNIAATDLQKGFMSLVRSVAKPESF